MLQCSLKSCGGRRNLSRFSLDEILRQKWIFVVAAGNLAGVLGQELCQAHFDQHSFEPLKRTQLKPGAIPTIKG